MADDAITQGGYEVWDLPCISVHRTLIRGIQVFPVIKITEILCQLPTVICARF